MIVMTYELWRFIDQIKYLKKTLENIFVEK